MIFSTIFIAHDLDQELAIFMTHISYQAGVLILKYERLDQKTMITRKKGL